MKRLPTVTIAVSAYNEEKNIKNFLKSVIAQKKEGFKLEKILIISDGSTDRTIEIVKTFKNPIIERRNYKLRMGLSARLNEMFSTLKSDILIKSDADAILAHPFVVRDVIQPILNDSKVGMCGDNSQPLKAETFTERAVNYTYEIYSKFRESVRGGNNLFSASGRILAFKKELAQKIFVPENMIKNDTFAYLSCLALGYKYRYVTEAVVYFRSPRTLKEHIKQNIRYLAYPARMANYFSEEFIKRERQIPKLLLLKNMAIQLLKHPLSCLYIFIVNRYCLIKAKKIGQNLNAKWDIAKTTKSLTS